MEHSRHVDPRPVATTRHVDTYHVVGAAARVRLGDAVSSLSPESEIADLVSLRTAGMVEFEQAALSGYGVLGRLTTVAILATKSPPKTPLATSASGIPDRSLLSVKRGSARRLLFSLV